MLRTTDKDRGLARVPERTWTWLAVVAAVSCALFGGPIGRWVAAALVLTLWPKLVRPLVRLPLIADRRQQIGRWLPVVLIAALAAILLGDLALGRPPISRDHGIHYFQTKILVDDLIPSGRLIGWSDRLNTGYPFGDSYPVLGYLLTGAANLLSFDLISLRTSYAWGLLAIWVLALVSVWWLAATIARELQGEPVALPNTAASKTREDEGAETPRLASLLDPRWAGAFAALAWLIDPGASREGGWNYLMFHGVWPQLLSSALWVASLPATWAALRRPSFRSSSLAALLLGGSILAHPFGILTAATSAVAWPIVVWASGATAKLPPGAIRWWLIIHVLAALIGVAWLATFLGSAESMSRSPVPYKPLGALASELVAGELFVNHRAWVGPLAVIGLILAIRRGRTMAWLGIGLVCALLVLASEAAITVLRLDLVVSSFKNLQFPRYAIALKPILHAFAGLGAAMLLARLRELPHRDHPATEERSVQTRAAQPRAARLLAALCLAPLVVGVVDDRGRLLPRPVGGVEVFAGSSHERVDEELSEALRAEANTEDGPRRLTVAFLRRGMGGGTYPLFAITDADAKLVLDGHIPAVNYKHQIRRRGPHALAMLGVTHVIYDRPLDRSVEDRRLAHALEPVGEFGPWTLARFVPTAESPGFSVGGKIEPEDVHVELDDPTRARVVVEAGGPGKVGLPIGPYRKWVAVQSSGETLQPRPISLALGLPGMELGLSGPGEVELEYRAPTIERVAGWIGLAALTLALAALGSSRERQLAERVRPPLLVRTSWAVGLVGLAALLVAGHLRQERQLGKTWAKILEAHQASARLAKGRELSFSRDLVDDHAYSVTRSERDGCDGTLGKDAMVGCAQEDARARVSMTFRAPYLYRCLRVEVPARGSLEIELDTLDEREDLFGFYVREGYSSEGLTLRFPGEEDFAPPVSKRRRQHVHFAAETREASEVPLIEMRNASERPLGLCFGLATATPR